MFYTTIGTCRLAHPFTVASNERFVRDQTNVYGYVHAAKEALQQLDFIFGQQLPGDFASFIASGDEFPVWRKRRPTDLWIVEISSLKEVVLDGLYLQINHLARVFGDKKQFLSTFWKFPDEGMRKDRSAALKKLDGYKDLDDRDLDFLERAFVNVTSEQALAGDMKDIHKRLDGKVVFVPHVNVPAASGQYISARVALLKYMRSIAKAEKFAFFNPTEHVEKYGVARAMLNGGADLNHYSDDFIEVLGNIFRARILERHADRQPFDLAAEDTRGDAAPLPIDETIREEEQLSAEHVAEDVKSIEEKVARLIAEDKAEEAGKIVARVVPEDRSPVMHAPLVRALEKQYKALKAANESFRAFEVLGIWKRLGYGDSKLASAVSSTARDIRNQARESIEGDRLEDALALLEKSHALFPDSAIVLRDFALASERADQHKAALLWAELYNLSKDEFDINRALNFARRARAWEDALRFHRSLAEIAPMDAEAKEREASTLRSAISDARIGIADGNLKRAESLLDAVLQHDPESTTAQSLVRNLRKKQNEVAATA